MRLAGTIVAWFAAMLVTAVACSLAPDRPQVAEPHRAEGTPVARASGPPTLQLPTVGRQLAPSLVSIRGAMGVEPLRDVEACESCHADVARQWRSSAHSLSSFSNPIYRVAVDRFRAETGAEESRFCAGCHDPALLVDQAMDADIEAADPRAHAGVSCRTCHSMVHATPDGNGSYTLSASTIVLPEPGDDASVRAHRERVAGPTLRTATLCASCHRSFLGPETGHPSHLAGTDDVGPWMRSTFAGGSVRVDDAIPQADCGGCHMPREAAPDDLAADARGTVASHRFVGGHTWLAAMTGDEEQLERTQAMLEGAVSIDVAAVRVRGQGRAFVAPEDANLRAGQEVEFDVVLRNRSVGHNFPGGTRDAQATWVQLRVLDAAGKVLAETAPDDRHELRAYVTDADGVLAQRRQVEAFRAVVVDHTIAPRDAVVVRHAWTVPSTFNDTAKVVVEARLLHQSRSASLGEATCGDAETPRGQAFAKAAVDTLGVIVDACAAQPITEIAAIEVALGSTASAADWRRPYEHGLGLLHDVQERIGDARAQLLVARSRVEDDNAREAAMITAALAEAAIAQGRFDEALELADRVDAMLDNHPAPAALRAKAHAGAWRWAESAAALLPAMDLVPGNDVLWADLAQAWNSAGRDEQALRAAVRGLATAPRSSRLLRTQSLTAAATDHPVAARAAVAYESNRPSDDVPHIRSRCAREDERCDRERAPIHLHRLQSPPF